MRSDELAEVIGPISPDGLAKLRESVRLLGDTEGLQWTNDAMAIVLATLDATLEQALDRMETAWYLLGPEMTPDQREGVAQALWFGQEELRAALAATPAPVHEGHRPGDPHEYDIRCVVCGEAGTVRLSIEPRYDGAIVGPEPEETR